jgi:polysaccharide deacetylase 2 family uncharacterized protein YibQ
MRANAKKVNDLESQFIREILNWFKIQPDLDAIEFNRAFNIQVEIDDTFLDYDQGTEEGIVIQLNNAGTITLEDGREIYIGEMQIDELAFILDELDDKLYSEIKLEPNED